MEAIAETFKSADKCFSLESKDSVVKLLWQWNEIEAWFLNFIINNYEQKENTNSIEYIELELRKTYFVKLNIGAHPFCNVYSVKIKVLISPHNSKHKHRYDMSADFSGHPINQPGSRYITIIQRSAAFSINLNLTIRPQLLTYWRISHYQVVPPIKWNGINMPKKWLSLYLLCHTLHNLGPHWIWIMRGKNPT